MLYRKYPPNQYHWNGLGGKIQEHETPLACIRREVLEEAGIDLGEAQRLSFAGIVTWPAGIDLTRASMGMYAFIAEFLLTWPIWEEERVTQEGILSWKSLAWVCDTENTEVVDNIAHFLPRMFAQEEPQEYYRDERGRGLTAVVVRPFTGV